MKLKFKDRPTICIQVNGIGFVFLLDTSIKYNLLDPCFVEFFYEEYPTSEEEYETNQKKVEEFYRQNPPFTPLHDNLKHFFFKGVYEKVGEKRIRCKDGVSRITEIVQFNFEYENKHYYELFCIDNSLCTYFMPKNKVAGILGYDFLKKYKWDINF